MTHHNEKLYFLIDKFSGNIYAGTINDFLTKYSGLFSTRKLKQSDPLNCLKRIIYKRSLAHWYTLKRITNPSAKQVRGAIAL